MYFVYHHTNKNLKISSVKLFITVIEDANDEDLRDLGLIYIWIINIKDLYNELLSQEKTI